MSLELPVLRLGVAGFSSDEQGALNSVVQQVSEGSWHIGPFVDADAWVVNGARVQVLLDTTVRIAAGISGARSVHLDLRDVDRPVAFSLPLHPRQFEPLYTFEANSARSVGEVLGKFEAWLRPLTAQFCLASRILEQERVLGPGVHHVTADGRLIAVVDMRGEIGVLPTAGAIDFEHAIWHARAASLPGVIPEHFVRSSLAQLMWQYAVRTSRDVLPERYRSGPLYFRRPPRVPQRLMTDSHLLLLRELAGAPDDFAGLRQRTGLSATSLSRDLAALYFVGAITTNAKRAAPRREGEDSGHSHQPSVVPSGLDSDASTTRARKRPPMSDMTAPAPIGPT